MPLLNLSMTKLIPAGVANELQAHAWMAFKPQFNRRELFPRGVLGVARLEASLCIRSVVASGKVTYLKSWHALLCVTSELFCSSKPRLQPGKLEGLSQGSGSQLSPTGTLSMKVSACFTCSSDGLGLLLSYTWMNRTPLIHTSSSGWP